MFSTKYQIYVLSVPALSQIHPDSQMTLGRIFIFCVEYSQYVNILYNIHILNDMEPDVWNALKDVWDMNQNIA